jgi:hypothetical protein
MLRQTLVSDFFEQGKPEARQPNEFRNPSLEEVSTLLAQFKIHPIKMKRDVLQEIAINKTRGQKLRKSFLSVK